MTASFERSARICIEALFTGLNRVERHRLARALLPDRQAPKPLQELREKALAYSPALRLVSETLWEKASQELISVSGKEKANGSL